MADWRIVTPTRAPMEDEMEGGVIFQVPASDSTVSARILYFAGTLVVQLFFVDPQVNVRYSFSNNEWIGTGLKPIDITTVDLTIPEEVVAAATIKTSYFNLIAYEKGTTACKLAVTNEAKTLIRNALINKGVDVPDTTPFRQYAGKVGEIGGSVAVDFNNPESYVDTYTYTDEDAVISTESNLKGNLVFGYFNFITNDFVWGSSGAYGMSSQANMMTPTPLPTEQTVLVTYDGVESAIVFDPVEKRISTTEYRTGSMTITVYKKM